jgi:hypothetical protein
VSRHLEHASRKRKGITLKPCVDSNWRRVCTQAPEGSEPQRDSEEGAEMAGALKQAATGVVGAAKKATEVQQKGALAAAALRTTSGWWTTTRTLGTWAALTSKTTPSAPALLVPPPVATS